MHSRIGWNFCACTAILFFLVGGVRAAHCLDPSDPQAETRPRVNIGGLTRHDPDAELRYTCKTIFHKDWNGDIRTGVDVAAIILDSPSFKTPLQMDIGGRKGEGLKLTAVGWGRTNLGSFADTLQEMDGFVMIDNEKCNLNVVYNGVIKDHMLCADGGAVDTCEGDSGGPLIFKDMINHEDVLVGVTSFGPEICGSRRLPSVATRVSSVVDWIMQVIAENPTCSDESQGPAAAAQKEDSVENTCNSKQGVDLNGGVLPLNDGRQTIKDSAGDCCSLCKNTEGCKSWTWISSQTEYNPQGACWLRDAVPTESFCPACTSGYIEGSGSLPDVVPEDSKNFESFSVEENDEENTDSKNEHQCSDVFSGVDLQGYDIDLDNVPNSSSIESCCDKCNNLAGCKSWTRTNDGKCFLKNGIPKIAICSSCNSGVMRHRVSEDELNPIKELMANDR